MPPYLEKGEDRTVEQSGDKKLSKNTDSRRETGSYGDVRLKKKYKQKNRKEKNTKRKLKERTEEGRSKEDRRRRERLDWACGVIWGGESVWWCS